MEEINRNNLTDEYLASIWKFEDDEQKVEMIETINEKNCGKKLKLVRDVTGISRSDLAKILGVSLSTITRLETKKSKPTKEFLLVLSGLVAIGIAKYSEMSREDKEKLTNYIGAGGGAAAGVAGSIAAVSASGTVAGLSAAGITSGLAAIGGGAMLGGIAVVAAIPLVVGAAGWGIVKGIKAICEANNLKCEEIDGRYEIVPDPIKVKDEEEK
jgi:transcriptional regulator with XRE-family HTH domain